MGKEKSIDKNKLVITIAVLSVVIGLVLVLQPFFLIKKEAVYDKMAFKIYNNDVLNRLEEEDENSSSSNHDNDNETDDKNNENSDNNNGQPENNGSSDSEKNNQNNVNKANSYIGSIEISKIGLKKGFVSPSSKYNDIQYNVTILKGFDYPDVKNGNFILVAHSGTGPQSYFKNLYKLKVGDTAVVTYNKKKYKYKIVNIYYQKKQGFLTIYRDTNKNTLTLITCTKDNKQSQTVYIAEAV